MSEQQMNDLKAKHTAAMESLGTLQKKLDTALQKHKDDAEAHAEELAALKAEHKTAMEEAAKKHRKALNAEKQRIDRIEFEKRLQAEQDAIQ